MCAATRDGKTLVNIAAKQVGSNAALARALHTNPATVYRWLNGQTPLTGTALIAVLAVIKHPGEYVHD